MAKNAKPQGEPVRCYIILLHVTAAQQFLNANST